MLHNNLRDLEKVGISRQQDDAMLHRRSGNPQIVSGNRPAAPEQIGQNACVSFGRRLNQWSDSNPWAAQELLKLGAVSFTPAAKLKAAHNSPCTISGSRITAALRSADIASSWPSLNAL